MKWVRTGVITALAILFTAGFTVTAKKENQDVITSSPPPATEKALFAGGCFWCMEKPFEDLEGVVSVISGYAGGTTENPTYENYGAGGHTEVVEVVYDPQKISYSRLLDVFWRQIDPTDGSGQFVDRGHEYISAIFVYNEQQRRLAVASRQRLAASGILNGPVVTEILDAPRFWKAEEYHQDYYKNNPIRYKFYRSRSGRDDFLRTTWKKVAIDLSGEGSGQDLRRRLSAMQYHVTRETAPSRLSRTNTGTTRKPVSTSISSPVSHSSARATSSIRGPAGPASPAGGCGQHRRA